MKFFISYIFYFDFEADKAVIEKISPAEFHEYPVPIESNLFHFSCCLALNTDMNASFELKNLGLMFEKLSNTAIVPTDSVNNYIVLYYFNYLVLVN